MVINKNNCSSPNVLFFLLPAADNEAVAALLQLESIETMSWRAKCLEDVLSSPPGSRGALHHIGVFPGGLQQHLQEKCAKKCLEHNALLDKMISAIITACCPWVVLLLPGR
ncbi:uncharacterized protein LOC119161015 isoform X4 [Rhipicephalus microplus]|uniref:uncharacterized protein LOC119161015 isoform X4 n=1 Tax=Rhipicephalus microplus TaxID=6941 RepID=UPI003F6B3F03